MRVRSLLYHDLVEGKRFDESGFNSPDADAYKLDRMDFEWHMESVSRVPGVEITTVHRAIEVGGGERRPLLLTFDDGGASAMKTAEILEKHQWRGHFFIVTNQLGQRGFLTREQVRELHDRGHVVGSHSHSHPKQISALPYARIYYEWRKSLRILNDLLGIEVTVASVPGGFYSWRVAQAAADAGILLLFNSEPAEKIRKQSSGMKVLGRYGLKRGDSPSLAEAYSRGDARTIVRERVFWNFKKVLKFLGGPLWHLARKKYFE